MAPIKILVAATLTLLLSGCASSSDGTLVVEVTDAPDNIGDFASLIVEVGSIEVKGGPENGTKSFEPSNDEFDLVKLTNGNVSTLFKGSLANGTYSKLELVITKATGTLKTGETVDVKAPKGSIFLPQKFEVKAGTETTFLFDIHVVKKGNGEYSLQPNAGGSKVKQTS